MIGALIFILLLAAPERVAASPDQQNTVVTPSQPTEGILTLAEVLRSSARTAPQIIEALARERAAEGRALTAAGAFDTVFEVDGRSRTLGYYDGTIVSGRATRPLEGNGGYLYGGYRLSRGSFPIYEDENYTNRLGEFKVGGLFSLLRDRLIDERRTRRTLAAGSPQACGCAPIVICSPCRRTDAEVWRVSSNWVPGPISCSPRTTKISCAARHSSPGRRGITRQQRTRCHSTIVTPRVSPCGSGPSACRPIRMFSPE
jgi:hypothetical protein